jgi:hypothetical protein
MFGDVSAAAAAVRPWQDRFRNAEVGRNHLNPKEIHLDLDHALPLV